MLLCFKRFLIIFFGFGLGLSCQSRNQDSSSNEGTEAVKHLYSNSAPTTKSPIVPKDPLQVVPGRGEPAASTPTTLKTTQTTVHLNGVPLGSPVLIADPIAWAKCIRPWTNNLVMQEKLCGKEPETVGDDGGEEVAPAAAPIIADDPEDDPEDEVGDPETGVVADARRFNPTRSPDLIQLPSAKPPVAPVRPNRDTPEALNTIRPGQTSQALQSDFPNPVPIASATLESHQASEPPAAPPTIVRPPTPPVARQVPPPAPPSKPPVATVAAATKGGVKISLSSDLLRDESRVRLPSRSVLPAAPSRPLTGSASIAFEDDFSSDPDAHPRSENTTDLSQKYLEKQPGYKDAYQDFISNIAAGRCPNAISQVKDPIKYKAFENALLTRELFFGFVKSLKTAIEELGTSLYVPDDESLSHYQNNESAFFQLVTKSGSAANIQWININIKNGEVRFNCEGRHQIHFGDCAGKLREDLTRKPEMIYGLTNQIKTQPVASEIDDKFRRYFRSYGYEFDVVLPRPDHLTANEVVLLFKTLKNEELAHVTSVFSKEGATTTQTLRCPAYFNPMAVFVNLSEEIAPIFRQGGVCESKTYSPIQNPSEYLVFNDVLMEPIPDSSRTLFEKYTTQVLTPMFEEDALTPTLQIKATHPPQKRNGDIILGSWGVAAARRDQQEVAFYEFSIWKRGDSIGRDCRPPIVYRVDESCEKDLDTEILALLADPDRLFPLALADPDMDDVAFETFWNNSGFSIVPPKGIERLNRNNLKLQRNSDLQNFTITRERPDDQGFPVVHELSCRLERSR